MNAPSKSRKLRQPYFEIRPSMDLCNLYIKCIPLSIKSVDLFNIFKEHGRIISARVMEEDEPDINKRYGFVSYSSSIEAAKALVSGKDTMIIRFHEPKVPRQEHNYTQQLELLINSSYAKYFYRRDSNNKRISLLSREPPAVSYVYYSPCYWNQYVYVQSKTDMVQEIIKSMKLEIMTSELEATLSHELGQLDHSELLLCLNNPAYCNDKFHEILHNTTTL